LPYPNQVTQESIVHQAWIFINKNGIQPFSLAKLASALGVKAPSLYRHVGNKATLLQSVNLVTLKKLFAALEKEAETAGSDKMLAILNRYRTFALAHPHTYLLAYQHNAAQRPDDALLTQMVLPIQAIMAQISGEADSLAALRGALALVHGFVLLELNEQLQRGGDLTTHFTQSVEAYLHGWKNKDK